MLHSTRARALAKLAIPAARVGVVSALSLIVLSVAAEQLQDVLWDDVPDATTVGDIDVRPALCIALLPVWLLVTDRPLMQISPERSRVGRDGGRDA